MEENILKRIKELESRQSTMNDLAQTKRLELAELEARANELRRVITANTFDGTEEARELVELRSAIKWIEIYSRQPEAVKE